jgi:hypothetical protein
MPKATRPEPARNRLWWWVAAAFTLQVAVWTGWLMFAARHPVAEVPLATEQPK